jgi:predicted MPP superfamily phosphohydrolase
MAMRGPFLYPRRYPPSREPRPPRFERRVKVPIGRVMDRLAAPFVRWRREALLTPEVVLRIPDLAPAFAGFRIALVTDLHNGPCVPDWWLEHVAERAATLAPDLVALGGDYVSHTAADLVGLDRALARFRAPAGVVAVLGNHDHWVGIDLVMPVLERAGVRVLHNGNLCVQRGDATLLIAGVDDFTHGGVRLDEALGGTPQHVPRVLLSHNPDLIEYLDGQRVDVMLAGHTHNGQMHFPLVGALTVPSQFGAAYLHGLKRRGRTQLYVSAGVGMASIPFRWGNPPELPVIRLEPTSTR